MLVANPYPNTWHCKLGPHPHPHCCLPCCPHYGHILKVFSILKGEYNVIQCINSVQWLTTWNLAQARPTMEWPWERLLQVHTSHRYHMRFSDACSSSRSPPMAAFVAPGSAPPPCCLPHCPHASTGTFTRPLAYPEVSSISLFGVQRLTTRRNQIEMGLRHVYKIFYSNLAMKYIYAEFIRILFISMIQRVAPTLSQTHFDLSRFWPKIQHHPGCSFKNIHEFLYSLYDFSLL